MPRISQEAKRVTRQKILDVARRLFRQNGFEASTTRDIAVAAGIATGTVFNYFPTKESIVKDFVVEGLKAARKDFGQSRREDASLEEDLFLHVSTGLRQLKKCRSYLQPVLETTLCPVARRGSDEAADAIRADHLEMMQEIVGAHMPGQSLSPMAFQLYWTLYTGLLAFWATDDSPKQEDARAMLDQSLSMFVTWLENETQNPT